MPLERSSFMCSFLNLALDVSQLLALPEDQQLEMLQAYMLSAAAEAAAIEELDPDQPLLELGLDSLRAAEFAVQVLTIPWHQHLSSCCQGQLPGASASIQEGCQAVPAHVQGYVRGNVRRGALVCVAHGERLRLRKDSRLSGSAGAHPQIEEHLSLSVPLTVVFEYPTIRQLAVHILHLLNTPESLPIGAAPEKETGASLAALADAAAAGAGGNAAELLLTEADKAAGVPCSPAQMYFVALQQLAPGGADANVPGGLRLVGRVDRGALQAALQAVMCRHDALRTCFLTCPDGSVLQVRAVHLRPLQKC